jgi:hypothetical protein
VRMPLTFRLKRGTPLTENGIEGFLLSTGVGKPRDGEGDHMLESIKRIWGQCREGREVGQGKGARRGQMRKRERKKVGLKRIFAA